MDEELASVLLLAYALANRIPIEEPNKMTKAEKMALTKKWREIHASASD